MNRIVKNSIALSLIILYSQLFATVNYAATMERKESVSFGSIQKQVHFTSYFHLRYSVIENDQDNKISKNHWSLRRFKLIANWKSSKTLQFYSQFIYKSNNYSGTDDRVYLQHAFIRLAVIEPLNFKIGQFKPPFGWERFQADFRLPVIERSQAIDRLIPNGSLGESFARDYGIQCFGRLSSAFQYECAVLGGSGAHTNLTDKNAPLLVGRLSFSKKFQEPVLHKNLKLSLQLAHSQRWNSDNNFTRQLPGCNETAFRHFTGRDCRFDYAFIIGSERSQFAAEYLSAEYLPDDEGQVKVSASGWFLKLSSFLSNRLQYVVRFEQFDPNQGQRNSYNLSWLTLGLDYYFNEKSNRLMVNYIHKKEARDELKNDMLVIQLQYFFLKDLDMYKI